MNIEIIVVGIVCILAVGVVTYYLYNKYSTQQTAITTMIDRIEKMERLIAQPPSPEELIELYNKPIISSFQNINSISEKPNEIVSHENKEIEHTHEVESIQIIKPLILDTNLIQSLDQKDL